MNAKQIFIVFATRFDGVPWLECSAGIPRYAPTGPVSDPWAPLPAEAFEYEMPPAAAVP
jgi:hypothetical protein